MCCAIGYKVAKVILCLARSNPPFLRSLLTAFRNRLLAFHFSDWFAGFERLLQRSLRAFSSARVDRTARQV
jgi:hypothetical protein